MMKEASVESPITPHTDSIQKVLVYEVLESGDGTVSKHWASNLGRDVIHGGLDSISGKKPITIEEKLMIENSPMAVMMLHRVLKLPQGVQPGSEAERFFRTRREVGSVVARIVAGAVKEAESIREVNSLYEDKVVSQ